MSGSKKVVAYFYDDELGNFYYGPQHPMKPHRIRMAHNLVLAYGLYKKLEIYRPTLMSEDQMTKFHADDYIHFLQTVTPDNQQCFTQELSRYNVDVDCFDESMQLLTKEGFKFVQSIGLDDELATFHESNKSIEYHKPRAVIEKNGNHRMIDILQGITDEFRSNSTDISQPNAVNMTVTAGHDMLVKKDLSSSEFRLAKATELLSENDKEIIQFLARAEQGINQQATLPFVNQLNLNSTDQIQAFIELYGFFLGGSSSFNRSDERVEFSPVKQADQDHLIGLIKRLPLLNKQDYQIEACELSVAQGGLLISINKPEYCDFFNQTEKSIICQRLFDWVWRLSKDQVRCLINGLCVATSPQEEQAIVTDSIQLRDDLIILCLHAGYSAYFELSLASGSVVYDEDSESSSLGARTVWRVVYSEDSEDCEPSVIAAREVKEREYSGKVYCVDVENHLVFARRAVENEAGIVTSASKPIITGNCPVFDGMFKSVSRSIAVNEFVR